MRKILPVNPDRYKDVTRPGDCGPAAQLQWLPIASLVVDDSYQRTIGREGERTVRTIIGKFDWRKFAPVIVSPVAGGLYAIVDGQHRTTAAAYCGHDSVPCAVIMADRQAQAESFGAINGTVTQVSRGQQFKAALAAGEPEALRIKAVADKAGVRILYSNTAAANLGVHETCALDAIRRAIFRHNDAIVTTSLQAVLASARDRGGFLRAQIITGVAEAIGMRREWSHHPKIVAAFRALNLDAMHRKAISEVYATTGKAVAPLFEAAIVSKLSRLLDTAIAAA